MNAAIIFLASLATFPTFAPFDDLSPDAKKDYQRLERRLEADMQRGSNDQIMASGRLLQAMRLSTRGMDQLIDGAPPLYGRYKAYGQHEYIMFHQDGRVEFEGWGDVKVVDKGAGWVAGVLPNGNRVEFRSTYDSGMIRLTNSRTGVPGSATVYYREER